MALGKQKSPGGRHKLTGANSGSISGSFASGKHIDLQVFEGEAALLYQIQTLQEDIEELRRYVTNEATGSAISALSGSIKVTLPNRAKGTPSGHLYTLIEKDGTKTIKMA
jgi:hypothetical protein